MLILVFTACGGQDGSDSTSVPSNQPPTSTPQTNSFDTTMLGLINDARAQARNCGNTFYPAAPPLNWDDRVAAAALAHSTDMAENNFFGHIGSDGSDPGDRLMNEGYDAKLWGEDIAVGFDLEADVMNAWLNSPDHCANIMDPSYEDVGVGVDEGMFMGKMEKYWTADLATEIK